MEYPEHEMATPKKSHILIMALWKTEESTLCHATIYGRPFLCHMAQVKLSHKINCACASCDCFTAYCPKHPVGIYMVSGGFVS